MSDAKRGGSGSHHGSKVRTVRKLPAFLGGSKGHKSGGSKGHKKSGSKSHKGGSKGGSKSPKSGSKGGSKSHKGGSKAHKPKTPAQLLAKEEKKAAGKFWLEKGFARGKPLAKFVALARFVKKHEGGTIHEAAQTAFTEVKLQVKMNPGIHLLAHGPDEGALTLAADSLKAALYRKPKAKKSSKKPSNRKHGPRLPSAKQTSASIGKGPLATRFKKLVTRVMRHNMKHNPNEPEATRPGARLDTHLKLNAVMARGHTMAQALEQLEERLAKMGGKKKASGGSKKSSTGRTPHKALHRLAERLAAQRNISMEEATRQIKSEYATWRNQFSTTAVTLGHLRELLEIGRKKRISKKKSSAGKGTQVKVKGKVYHVPKGALEAKDAYARRKLNQVFGRYLAANPSMAGQPEHAVQQTNAAMTKARADVHGPWERRWV